MLKLLKNKKAYWANQHILISLVVLGILFYFNLSQKWIEVKTDTTTLISLGVVGIVFAMLPDVDSPNTIINKYVTFALVGVVLLAFWKPEFQKYGIVAAVVIGLLRYIEHRTLIHSVVGAIVIAAPLFYFGVIYFIVGFIAFMSHIVADGEVSFFTGKDLW